MLGERDQAQIEKEALLVGRRPAGREQEDKVGEARSAHEVVGEVAAAHRRPGRSTRPRSRSCGPGLPISMASPSRPIPSASRVWRMGIGAIVGQYQRGRGCQTSPSGRTGERAARSRCGGKRARRRVPPAHGATVAFIVERLREDIWAGRLEPGSRLDRKRPDGPLCGQPRAGARGAEAPQRRRADRASAAPRGGGPASHRARDPRTVPDPDRNGGACRPARRRVPTLPSGARAFSPRSSRSIPTRRATLATISRRTRAFHDAVMALADNLELRNLAIRLQLPLIMAQVGDVLTPPVLEASVREHRAIAKAILRARSGRRVGAHARTSRTGGRARARETSRRRNGGEP